MNFASKSLSSVCSISVCFLVVACIQMSCYEASHIQHPYQYNPYSFGYDVEDNYGNQHWRQERSHNPMEVHGSYGYRDNNGIYREVVYVADKNGFRANVKSNEPGVSGTKDPADVKMESYHPSPTTHTKPPVPGVISYYKPGYTTTQV